MPEKKQTIIGGQALIEGIIMIGPDKSSTVVRRTSGELEVLTEDVTNLKEKYPVLGFIFIRGVAGLFMSMKRGIKALNYSSNIALEDESFEEDKMDKWLGEKFGEENKTKVITLVASVIGIIIPLILFFLLPTLLAGLWDKILMSTILRNICEGVIRIIIFFIFLFAVSKMPDMKRVFAYHGAEHKAIACYEAGEELTPQNAAKFKKEHPRCGTSFLFSVMIVSIIVFSFVSWSNPFIRFVLRLALLPVVVGVSYEINRYIGRNNNFLCRFLRFPGEFMQRFTTNTPDDTMLEVACTALSNVIPSDDTSDKW